MSSENSSSSRSAADIVADFEKRNGYFSIRDVDKALGSLGRRDGDAADVAYWGENIAFALAEKSSDQNLDAFGKRFCPQFSMTNQSGEIISHPDLSLITGEVVEYWVQRARNAISPVLRCRYAGLACAFLDGAGRSRSEMARIRIECSLQISALSDADPIVVFPLLKHSLELAIVLKDDNLKFRVRDRIVEFEGEVALDDLMGLWGHAFDLLIDRKNIDLSEAVQARILRDLEGRLQRTSRKESLHPWAAECAATRLATYYQRHSQHSEARRVLLLYALAFEQMSESTSSALQRIGWLEDVARVLQKFRLEEDTERILKQVRDIGTQAVGELKPISASMRVSQEQIDTFVNEMNSGGLELAIENLVDWFVPREEKIIDWLRVAVRECPLVYMLPRTVMDHRGRRTDSIGSLDHNMKGDIAGHVAIKVSESLPLKGLFLDIGLNDLISRYQIGAEELTALIVASPIFRGDKHELIAAGVKNFLGGDYAIAIHLLIPQIEDALRELLEMAGGQALKPSRDGGRLDLRTLDDILRDELIGSIFGDDVVLYLRVLLTDSKGMNLRNRVCHGLMRTCDFNQGVANLIIHALLVLSRVRGQARSDDASNRLEGVGSAARPL